MQYLHYFSPAHSLPQLTNHTLPSDFVEWYQIGLHQCNSYLKVHKEELKLRASMMLDYFLYL